MDDFRMEEHRMCGRNRWWKYVGIVLATLIGSFFAFYFAVSCAISYFMSPAFAMHEMHKMNREATKDFKSFEKDGFVFQRRSAVEFVKTPESYKFVVDLTPFQGNADSVNVNVEGRIITISGESSTTGKNTETYTKMSQSYSLCPKANIDKLSKKKVDNKYIITIPIED